MEQMNIANFSLQEVFKESNVQSTFHDGCLILTYHGINKKKIAPIFSYPCRINAMTAIVCERGKVRFTSNLKQYILQENMLYINVPNTIVKVDEIEDSVVHLMSFDENFLRDVHIDLHNLLPQFSFVLKNPCITISTEELDDMRQLFETIEREMKKLSGKPYPKIRNYHPIHD